MTKSSADVVGQTQVEALESRSFGVPIADGEQLAAEGVELVLANGTKVRVRFGMRELRAIESRMGSIGELADALALPYSTRQATAVAHTVSVMLGVSLEAVDQFLDPRQLPVYCQGIDLALREAMPVAEVGESPKATATPASTGQPTTT